MRFIAWITAACALSLGATFLILGLGPLAGGVWIAVAAAVVIVCELVNAVRKDRDDKLRRERDEVWQRRVHETPFWQVSAPDQQLIYPAWDIQPGTWGFKPWPVGDDEVRR